MTRIEKLTAAIEENFAQPTRLAFDKKTAHFERSIMDMYQVTKVQKNHIELTQLFDDSVISPVIFDNNIHCLLRRNDTFLLNLGLKDAKWHVISMSPPYLEGNV